MFHKQKKYATECIMTMLFREAWYKSYACTKQIICFNAEILQRLCYRWDETGRLE